MIEEFERRVQVRFIALDRSQSICQRVAGVGSGPRNGCMRTDTLKPDVNLHTSLLACTKEIGEAAAGFDRCAAALVHGKLGLKRLRVVVGKPSESPAATVLFVGAAHESQAVG